MFLDVLLKEGSHFHLLCLKTPKFDNAPSIRYGMIWSHDVPNVKQHIRLY